MEHRAEDSPACVNEYTFILGNYWWENGQHVYKMTTLFHVSSKFCENGSSFMKYLKCHGSLLNKKDVSGNYDIFEWRKLPFSCDTFDSVLFFFEIGSI